MDEVTVTSEIKVRARRHLKWRAKELKDDLKGKLGATFAFGVKTTDGKQVAVHSSDVIDALFKGFVEARARHFEQMAVKQVAADVLISEVEEAFDHHFTTKLFVRTKDENF